MKFHDSGAGFVVDAVVRTGGHVCDEYGTHFASDGAIFTWIPVEDGSKIVVETGFLGKSK